jgi:hypothetical protein
MNSSIIGKIEKARRYAQEPERIRLSALTATFHGSNDDYAMTLDDGAWRCSCHTFEQFGSCAHVMAAQRLLAPMLPESARYEQTRWTVDPGSAIIGKIEKARRYAAEPERFAITSLDATFRGSNDDHPLTLGVHGWGCTCLFFEQSDSCAHVMAAQRLLSAMLPESARYAATAALVPATA